jgi:hypothetical protein
MTAILKHPNKCLGVTSFKFCDRLLRPHLYVGALALFVSCSALGKVCSEVVLSPQLGTEISRWEEVSRSGKRLVTENGRLHFNGLMLSAHCTSADWALAWSQSKGSRTYLGATNTGQTATTFSDVGHQRISGSVHLKASENLSLGVRAVHNSIHRNIQSTSEAAGYPEHFQFNDLSLGVRYKQSVSTNLIWQAEYWQGRIFPGQSNVVFPNFAPSTLQLGAGHTREIGLSIGSKLGANDQRWTWSAAIHIRQDRIEEGTPQALYKGSRVVASAVQPEINLRSSQLSAKLNYAF